MENVPVVWWDQTSPNEPRQPEEIVKNAYRYARFMPNVKKEEKLPEKQQSYAISNRFGRATKKAGAG
jgi:hypothetical protein